MSAPKLAYINGDIIPMEDAKVSVLDRGFLFADGIYEVSAVLDGHLVDNDAHIARLKRSLGEIELACPVAFEDLAGEMQRLVEAEGLEEGMVYLQVTRGADSRRDFHYPDAEKVPSTLVMFCQGAALRNNPSAVKGTKVVTVPELRWARRDIKSVALLAQVIAKQAAVAAGASEAWMIEDGFVTEGSSSAACIITQDNVLVTRPVDNSVLDSITRRATLRLAEEMQLKVEERLFTADESYAAKEAFTASASALIMPIVDIDGHSIGAGTPGPFVTRLREIYLGIAESENPQF